MRATPAHEFVRDDRERLSLRDQRLEVWQGGELDLRLFLDRMRSGPVSLSPEDRARRERERTLAALFGHAPANLTNLERRKPEPKVRWKQDGAMVVFDGLAFITAPDATILVRRDGTMSAYRRGEAIDPEPLRHYIWGFTEDQAELHVA